MRTADRQRTLAQRVDIVAAAVVALDAGHIGATDELSRRRRWQLLSMDVGSDLAAVAVARRGKRTGLVVETHCFRRHDDGWIWEEVGPSVDYDEPTLPPRLVTDRGGYSDASERRNVKTGNGIGLWHLVAQAERVRTNGRARVVPPHGWVVTIDPAAEPHSEILDANDLVIGHLTIDHLRLPWRHRAAMWWNRRRHPDRDQWFNGAPKRPAE